MNKKIILIVTVVLVIITSGVFYFLYKRQSLPVKVENNTTSAVTANYPISNSILETSNNNSLDCYDCGKAGWQKMSEKCEESMISKNDFRSCLMNFSWSSANQDISTDEINEGYIEIGSSEVLKNPTSKSIEVFIYHQWAVGKDGDFYLLEELG